LWFYFIHHLYLDKEIPKGLISKILLEITCYYSLLMFGKYYWKIFF
jgi:hypothetical protein